MRDLDFEVKVANEEVCGVKAVDVKIAILREWSNPENIPTYYREKMMDGGIIEGEFLQMLSDIASFAVMCELRNENRVEEFTQLNNLI